MCDSLVVVVVKLVEASGDEKNYIVRFKADLHHSIGICITFASIQGGGLSSIIELRTEFFGRLIRPMAAVLFAFFEVRMFRTNSSQAAGDIS